MALFTDGTISTMEDVIAYESSILDVTATEGIDLQTKLALAQQELGVELEAFMAGRQIGTALGNVVATEPMKKWHVFQTLTLVYRDAYNRQLNDRYLGKNKEYQRLARWAWEALFQCGIGMTARPLTKADKPEVTAVDAAGAAAAVYYVRAAWSDGAQEGCPSDVAVISVAAGNLASVRAVNPPEGAQGWNVYAGYSATDLTRQNDAALAAGAQWTVPAAGLRRGAAPGAGQAPEYFVRAGRVLPRG